MRIIPKKTRVSMEFFKGIELTDIIIACVGVTLTLFMLLSNLPFRWIAALILFILFVASIIPVEDEKAYRTIYYAIKYAMSYKTFRKNPEKKGEIPVQGITPFTGISGTFIEYGDAYSGIVVEIPSIEFRFLTESRQNQLIDQVYGSILRTVTETESAAMVKIDRPVLYDSFIRTEKQKQEDLKAAFIRGMLSEEELTVRIGIIQDRIKQLDVFNEKELVYLSHHYLVFFGKDKSHLESQAEDMLATMGTHGMDCHVLNEQELAIFLKYNYSVIFDEREAWNLQPDQYMDWILPDRIQVTSRTVTYDEVITHNIRITDYPILVENAWGHGLFNRPDTRVVLKMKPIDRYKGIRQIDRAIDELREQGNSTGKTSKLMELNSHIETLAEVLSLLQGDNEVLMDVNIYITAYDYELSEERQHPEHQSKKQGQGLKRQIRRELSEGGFKSTDLFLRQFEAYASSNVSAYDAFRREGRGIQSGSIAAAFPYVYKLMMDAKGICLGRNAGRPVFVDFFVRDRERVNSNMVVIGKSGSGKSYATKMMLANLAAENSKIFILDPENEYTGMAKNLSGKVIDVGSATEGRLNPFHVITGLSDDDDDDGDDTAKVSFNMHMQFLEEFYRQILTGIEPDALEYLNNITIRMYESKGIDNETDLSKLEPEDYPTFDDLYEKILNDFQMSTGTYSKNNLTVLLNYISKFATGGRNAGLWNGPASINTLENFIVFNFQSLLANKNNTVANAQMLLVLKWLDNEIIKNRDYNLRYGASRKIVIVIDEAHVFIDSKYPIALDFMYQMAKRIRKYNGMQIIITQNVKDFVGTEELARKSTAIINACQYSFIFPLSPNDMHDLCKLYEKAGAINESEQEEIVNNGRGRAFVVTSPSERSCIDIEAPRDIEQLFTM
ncbi:MAG: ATP-binding protein [Enterocloster asparagiformis]|nr:ATP-binding protein [Enterocloster asparagiformis]